MIKRFWVIRSREKLFWGLTAASILLLALYTLLTVSVLPGQIPLRPLPWGETAGASRLWLLLLPLLSALFAGLLFAVRRRELVLPFLTGGGLSPETAQKRRGVYLERLVYEAFLLTLFFFFWQIDMLNTAKELPGFSPAVPVLFFIAALVYAVVSLLQIRRIR